MSKWIKGCEICNAGLVARMDDLVVSGVSVRKAAEILAKEGERKIGDLVYTAAAIRARYIDHKGLRNKTEVVCFTPPDIKNTEPKQVFIDTPKTKTENEQQPMEEVVPEPDALSAAHYTEVAKASAAASRPKASQLENAANTIERAARYLERIVEGDLKDNGTSEDRLFAESIRRHGPSIIISYYQLGIDPEKAIRFYEGEKKNVASIECKTGT